jgi:DNA replication regulator SLD3
MSNAVQVKATPTNFRFKDMFPAKPELVEDVALLGSEEIIPPSSIGPMVPSTAPRRGYKSALPGSASSTLGAITGTPHRSTLGRLTYQQAANEDEVILPSSPLMCRDLAKHSPDFEDSTRPVRKLDFMSCKPEVACETPVKGSLSAVSQLAAGVTGGDGEGKKLTIYQQMGWDDDDLDDFL